MSPSAAVAAPQPPDPHRTRRILLGIAAGVGLVASGTAVGTSVFFLHRYLTSSPHFAVRDIRVPALQHVTADSLRARAGVPVGENLFSVDLDSIEDRLARDPWLRGVRVHRELPSALSIEANEREAACAVTLGAIYLADDHGVVFKRASLEEAAAFPLVTGIPRAGYIHDRDLSQTLLREALAAYRAWRAPGPNTAAGGRAPVGEIHVDQAAGVTIYTRTGGLGVKLGRGDDKALASRLARVDAVLVALSQTGERPQIIYADQPHHPERVTVKLFAAAPDRSDRTPVRSPEQRPL